MQIETINDLRQQALSSDELKRWLASEQEYHDLIRRFIIKNGGQEKDVEDTIQEGIYRLLINIENDAFRRDSSLKTYLFRICRNIWISQLRRQCKWREIEGILSTKVSYPLATDHRVNLQDRAKLLEEALASLSPSCREVLRLWTLGYSMKEIAVKTGYKNAGSCKKKKSICLKALIEYLKDKPALMKELLNYRNP